MVNTYISRYKADFINKDAKFDNSEKINIKIFWISHKSIVS